MLPFNSERTRSAYLFQYSPEVNPSCFSEGLRGFPSKQVEEAISQRVEADQHRRLLDTSQDLIALDKQLRKAQLRTRQVTMTVFLHMIALARSQADGVYK